MLPQAKFSQFKCWKDLEAADAKMFIAYTCASHGDHQETGHLHILVN